MYGGGPPSSTLFLFKLSGGDIHWSQFGEATQKRRRSDEESSSPHLRYANGLWIRAAEKSRATKSGVTENSTHLLIEPTTNPAAAVPLRHGLRIDGYGSVILDSCLGMFGRNRRYSPCIPHSSSSSSSSLPPPFGAVLLPLSASFAAARRFSTTRWRMSANIAGLSLMNAFAFSRPWPMRVPL